MTTKSVKQPINLNAPKVAPRTPKRAAAPIEDVNLSHYDRALASMKALGLKVPGWKRTLVSLIVAFFAGCGIGMVANVLIDMVLIATSFSVFGYILSCLIFIAALYAGFKTGQSIGMYIVTGDIDRDIGRVVGKVKGWFQSTPVVA
jgi:hypothetical protein